MSFPENSIYSGRVWHKRISPREHAFKYRVFYVLQDLDDFDGNAKSPWCLSLNKFNVFSLREKDYGANSAEGLKVHIISELNNSGLKEEPVKIFMLTMPRMLGYGFNPITVFFCYDADSQVIAVIYEVHNTFGQNHSYLFAIDPDDAIADHGIDKSLYVSPFYDVTGKYRFRVNPPTDTLDLLIHYLDDANTLRMTAALSTTRQPLISSRLMTLFLIMPFATLKVVLAIHFEALKLWLKKTALASRPAPPKQSYSIPKPSSNVKKT